MFRLTTLRPLVLTAPPPPRSTVVTIPIQVRLKHHKAAEFPTPKDFNEAKAWKKKHLDAKLIDKQHGKVTCESYKQKSVQPVPVTYNSPSNHTSVLKIIASPVEVTLRYPIDKLEKQLQKILIPAIRASRFREGDDIVIVESSWSDREDNKKTAWARLYNEVVMAAAEKVIPRAGLTQEQALFQYQQL